MIENNGFPAENHTVITEDGYILEIHRIPHTLGNNESSCNQRTAVILQHGLLGSSADFLIAGKYRALGINLVFSELYEDY